MSLNEHLKMHISNNRISGLSFVDVQDGNNLPLAVDKVKRNEVDGIGLNLIRNWPKTDINVISSCPNIKFLYIHYAPFDYSVVNELENIVQLGIDTDDRNEIVFSNKPRLRNVSLHWRAKAKSLFECRQLEDLWMGKYNGKNLSDFENLSNLKSLRINTGSISSLNGIENLSKLENLYLAQVTKLEDISAIENLKNLKSLTINNCKKIKNIEVINSLKNIDIVNIMGTTPKNGVQHNL
tara:strand:+ start:28 stop:741 length:714 start_codon:yes stop_codon:yes gene_type:complete